MLWSASNACQSSDFRPVRDADFGKRHLPCPCARAGLEAGRRRSGFEARMGASSRLHHDRTNPRPRRSAARDLRCAPQPAGGSPPSRASGRKDCPENPPVRENWVRDRRGTRDPKTARLEDRRDYERPAGGGRRLGFVPPGEPRRRSDVLLRGRTPEAGPRIYLHTCRELEVAPEDFLFVGDGGSDELRPPPLGSSNKATLGYLVPREVGPLVPGRSGRKDLGWIPRLKTIGDVTEYLDSD